ncbi:MAG: hypothetical protein AAGE92_17315, partial [Cyanobacteria bacterium P01_G01_bin.4]
MVQAAQPTSGSTSTAKFSKSDLSSADHAVRLKAHIINRSAKVGVVGLGYVGLPFAVEKAKVG